MSVDKLEDVLLLPSELLENWSGIALDIGKLILLYQTLCCGFTL